MARRRRSSLESCSLRVQAALLEIVEGIGVEDLVPVRAAEASDEDMLGRRSAINQAQLDAVSRPLTTLVVAAGAS